MRRTKETLDVAQIVNLWEFSAAGFPFYRCSVFEMSSGNFGTVQRVAQVFFMQASMPSFFFFFFVSKRQEDEAILK